MEWTCPKIYLLHLSPSRQQSSLRARLSCSKPLEYYFKLPPSKRGGSVIPAAVKTPGNKLVRIIMPGINMVAVKKPEKNSPK